MNQFWEIRKPILNPFMRIPRTLGAIIDIHQFPGKLGKLYFTKISPLAYQKLKSIPITFLGDKPIYVNEYYFQPFAMGLHPLKTLFTGQWERSQCPKTPELRYNINPREAMLTIIKTWLSIFKTNSIVDYFYRFIRNFGASFRCGFFFVLWAESLNPGTDPWFA